MNDPQFLETSRSLARRVLLEHEGETVLARAAAFRSLTGRRPRKGEQVVLAALYDEAYQEFEETPAAAKLLLSIGEAGPDKKLKTARHAAMTIVCSTILGSDATVTMR